MAGICLDAYAGDSLSVAYRFGDAGAFKNCDATLLSTPQQHLVHHRATQSKRCASAKPLTRHCDVMTFRRVEDRLLEQRRCGSDHRVRDTKLFEVRLAF